MPRGNSSLDKQEFSIEQLENLISEAGLDIPSAPLRSIYSTETTDPGSIVSNESDSLRAAYNYFGGKSSVAHIIWEAFGSDVGNYIELFAGSAAVLLARPPITNPDKPHHETVNDADGFIVNCLRAIKGNPAALAAECEYPPTEIDLIARHHALLKERAALTTRLVDDPECYDIKIAGWWLWGTRSWIGAGWCSPRLKAKAKLPRAVTPGWQGGSALNHLSALSQRLRYVRITCRNWDQVAKSQTTTTALGTTAVFLDPPYSQTTRPPLYSYDDPQVAVKVRKWALDPERYNNPKFKIALCGYEFEHDKAIPKSWKRVYWRTTGGHGNQGHGRGRKNAGLETIWFSPHCQPVTGSVTKEQQRKIKFVPFIDLTK